MLSDLDPAWLRAQVASSGFGDAFAKADPCLPDYHSNLQELLDFAAERLRATVEAGFLQVEPGIAFRNALALTEGNLYLMSALARAARQGHSAELTEIHKRVVAELKDVADGDSGLLPILLGEKSDIPHLPRAGPFKPGLRLRYALARATSMKLDCRACLRAAVVEARCSMMTAQRELRRILESARGRDIPVLCIGARDVKRLSLHEKRLLTTDTQLLDRFLEKGVDRRSLRKETGEAWRTKGKVRVRLKRIAGLLLDRKITAANRESASLGLAMIDGSLRKELRSCLQKAVGDPRPSVRAGWVPLSTSLVPIITEISGKKSLASLLALPISAIVANAAKEAHFARGLPSADLMRLQRSLSEDDQFFLAKAGRFDLVTHLTAGNAAALFPEFDAVASRDRKAAMILSACLSRQESVAHILPVLGQELVPKVRALIRSVIDAGGEFWQRALIGYLGTPVAQDILQPTCSAAAAALALLKSDPGPADRQSFKRVLCDWIIDGLEGDVEEATDRLKSDPNYVLPWLRIGVTLLQVAPEELPGIAQKMGADRVVDLIEVGPRRHRFIRALSDALTTPPAVLKFAQARILRNPSAIAVLRELELNSRAADLLAPELIARLSLGRDSASQSVAILCLRRAPKQLHSLIRKMSVKARAPSLRRAASLLPLTSRDRGYLELAAALGPMFITVLAALMARIRRDAESGHKLDHLYHQYALPKRSGGVRTVSVPDPLLKRVQRGLLKYVLTPIGAHSAAYGFVAGRSILMNAEIHVGREVVVNCDVRNCFPSVKWPLVLGVARRDLGPQLGPAAISLIVDICTAFGGLPIGAPTSPALLNRALFKTDQILTAAAATRDCRYTRYADDLTFSGSGRAVGLLGIARRTLSQIGLELDDKKTNIYRRGRRQIVTGLVVNERVSVPRHIRRRMRAAVHAVENGRDPAWHGAIESEASLKGRLAFLKSINERAGLKLLRRLRQATKAADD